MNLFDLISILITLSAIFGYVNYRYIRLPSTIGLMLISLVMSLTLIILGHVGPGIEVAWARELVGGINFNKTLMGGMLSFLLFAGALQININELLEKKWEIIILTTVGVIISTFVVGSIIFWISQLLGLALSYFYCLLFGAVISPTDPIAVLGIIKQAGIPKSLETLIAGESLFNDGIGVVVFLLLLNIVTSGLELSLSHIALLFIEEVIGGIAFGLLLGWIVFRLLKSVDYYQVEILITLAIVTGGYSLASALHISGPLAEIVAGLLIGNHGRRLAMSEKTREHLDNFWELIDEILNALLFVIIGLEILVITFSTQYILYGLLAIPIVLLARFISISVSASLIQFHRKFSQNVIRILTWGGLRGGISVALALSLPKGSEREIILAMTYAVVVFSVLVQGLTIKSLIKQ